MKSIIKQKNIIIFTIITFTLSFFLLKSTSSIANNLAQATPVAAALLLVLFSKQKITELKELGLFNFGKVKWYIIAFILPSAAILISYVSATLLGYFSLDLKMPWYILIYRMFIFTFMWPFLFPMAEEIGWRGFLQPKLTTQFGLRTGIYFTGIIWACWHYIFIFTGDYYEAGNPLINTLLFSIMVILMTFSIGWIRSESKSFWPCVLFHSASNTAWMFCKFNFNIINTNYIYISGEAGIINIIFWAIILLIIWRKMDSRQYM